MNTSNGTAVCVIQPNPDVTGTGIRASIYALAPGGRILQFLISQIFEREDYKEFKGAVDNALGLQGLVLLCTAIHQIFRHQLTLFHVICVVRLLALLGVNVVSQGQYQGLGPRRVTTIMAITVIAGGAFSFLLMLTCAAPCIGLLCYLQRKHGVDSAGPRWIWNSPPLSPIQGANPRVAQWIGVFLMVEFSINAIVSLEETIKRNHTGAQERDWTFGQILPVFLLLGVANELLNLFLASLDRKAAGVAPPRTSRNSGVRELCKRSRNGTYYGVTKL